FSRRLRRLLGCRLCGLFSGCFVGRCFLRGCLFCSCFLGRRLFSRSFCLLAGFRFWLGRRIGLFRGVSLGRPLRLRSLCRRLRGLGRVQLLQLLFDFGNVCRRRVGIFLCRVELRLSFCQL